jgi:hypothetical protein
MEHEHLRSPLCIRLTLQERTRLEYEAGELPLSSYVRSRLFDAGEIAPRRRLSGSLPVCPETSRDIYEAYLAIQAMRQDLLSALGS